MIQIILIKKVDLVKNISNTSEIEVIELIKR